MRRILLFVLFAVGAPAVGQAQTTEPVPPVPQNTGSAPAMAEEVFPGTGEQLSSQSSWVSDVYVPAPARSACPNPWTFSTDLLLLDRNFNSHNFLGQTVTTPGGAPVAPLYPGGASVRPGMRLQLSYMIDDELSLEGIYFGLQNWSSNGTVLADPAAGIVAFSPFTQSDKLLGGFDQSLGYSYSSRLNNAEVNFRAPVARRGRWTRENLLGIRFVEWNESFNLTGQDQFFNVSENLNTHTSNSLLGTQIGTAVRGNWDRWSLNMTGKSGLFMNFVSERFSNLNSSGVTTGFPPGFAPITRGKVSTEVAGVFDFSAIATYRINANWSARGGYQVLYLAGVALASQQLSGFSHGGDVFLHGPSGGFEFRH